MREIKFRAWTEIAHEDLGMKYGVAHDYNNTVMQYTGLEDKNVKEIYEGDIVKCPLSESSASYLYLEAGDLGYVIRTISIPEVYQEGLPDDCEIIGNIYENPELLK